MPVVSKREDVERRLNSKPREWAFVVAARSALRVVPMLGIGLNKHIQNESGSSTRELILPTFRRLSVSWVAAAWSVVNVVPSSEKYYSSSNSSSANFAADAAIEASNAIVAIAEPASYAANSIVFAVRSVGASHADYIWNAVWADIAALESNGPLNLRPSDLAIQALWATGVPGWANGYWLAFKRALLEENDDWNVWTDWYEARLNGAQGEFPIADIESARASVPETIWSQSPRVVNAYIRRIVGAGLSEGSPSLPPEGPGPAFTPTPSGFEIVPTPPTKGEREDSTQISLHGQLRRRIERAARVMPRIQNTHKALFDEFNDYAIFADENLATLDVPSLWSAGAALNDMVEAFGRLDLAPNNNMSERLEPDILSQLRSLLRDHTTFIMGFEQGQELAARAAALRALDVRVGDLAARSRGIFVPMLRTRFLLATNAQTLVQSIDRTLDVVDEKTTALVGAAVAVGTRSIIAFGRAVAPLVAPAVVVSSLTGVNLSTLMGDANGEAIRAAATYLAQNANALSAFASHDAQLKLWLDWLISEIKRNAPK